MRLKTLSLSNFRGIRSLALDFPEAPATHVLVGTNGAGKTAVLDALAVLFSRLVARIVSEKGRGRSLRDDDVTNGESRTEITVDVSLRPGEPVVGWATGHTLRPRSSANGFDLSGLRRLADDLREHLVEDEEASVPLVVYYPVNRAVLDIPLRIRKKHRFDQAAAYDEALSGGSANFRVFFEWFRNREDLENERRVENPKYRDRQLQAVRSAVEALLPGFTDLRVRRKPLRMTVRKAGVEVTIQQLSDGEKCLLAMTGDLARRLALANPARDDSRAGSGIVLIDEIELHLHPAWQRRVVPALERAFPHCQFILTSHSPAVLGHVEPEAVCLLERTPEKVEAHRLTTKGQDVSRILQTIFGVSARPEPFEERLSELFARIEAGRLDEARTLVAELREVLGPGEPQLIKADAHIRRKEILGR